MSHREFILSAVFLGEFTYGFGDSMYLCSCALEMSDSLQKTARHTAYFTFLPLLLTNSEIPTSTYPFLVLLMFSIFYPYHFAVHFPETSPRYLVPLYRLLWGLGPPLDIY